MLFIGWLQIAIGMAIVPAWIESGHFFSVIGAASFQMLGQGTACLWWVYLQNKQEKEEREYYNRRGDR